MFGLGKRRFLEAEVEEFHVHCWAWLLRNTPHRKFGATPLVLPTREFFETTSASGPELGRTIFRDVSRLAQVEAPYLHLIPETEIKDRVISVRTGSLCAPSGTFGVCDDDRAEIRYNTALLDDPPKLICIFAHELGHLVNGAFPEGPPGGKANIEAATDVTSTFLGFGVFHSAILDVRSDRRRYLNNSSGQPLEYLSSIECAFDLAIFCALRGADVYAIKPFVPRYYWADTVAAAKYLKSSACLNDIQSMVRSSPGRRTGRNFWAERDGLS